MIPKYDIWKLQCTLNGATVKIEVNGTKRGVIGEIEEKMLCQKAQQEFSMACKARTVSYSQLWRQDNSRIKPTTSKRFI